MKHEISSETYIGVGMKREKSGILFGIHIFV